VCFLIDDGWNDYGYKTLFRLVYFDKTGTRRELGELKVMRLGMDTGQVEVRQTFRRLGKSYASLGTDQKFYENIAALGSELTMEILDGLRDSAWRPEIFQRFSKELPFTTSLMRGLRKSDIHKFSDIANGRAILTPFEFEYEFPNSQSPGLLFKVTPHALPPTNIHTIIGRNGVGKTRLLKSLISLLCDGESEGSEAGRLTFTYQGDEEDEGDGAPANLIFVAFSAFDDLELPLSTKGTKTGIKLSYIGLRRREKHVLKSHTGTVNALQEKYPMLGPMTQLKSLGELTKEFVGSLQICLQSSRKQLWLNTISILESDPIFGAMCLRGLADYSGNSLGKHAESLFNPASSGHKIVLLTLTRLVELVEERTLVLIDEPEAHLHPPLQASFIRALSTLLTARNGVAILATHSPVMLQEVPRDCGWLLFRDGDITSNERPQIETFAENLGVLTREVFRVEVTQSGYHTLLQREVKSTESVDQLFARFHGRLGAEGRAIARSLWRHRGARNPDVSFAITHRTNGRRISEMCKEDSRPEIAGSTHFGGRKSTATLTSLCPFGPNLRTLQDAYAEKHSRKRHRTGRSIRAGSRERRRASDIPCYPGNIEIREMSAVCPAGCANCRPLSAKVLIP
jgi:ABC-type transport system involved in cytochrome c biogenesis ATPase subunit